ncbi:MAG: bifunctional demethylmenaquinone methyltransferase/2-methoxy-6-polyprenyl-1,4-benzoquinol methylase UbiE [Alistipes sp.]
MKPYHTEQTKTEEVRQMFDRIAPTYDTLNHTLSLGIDKLWRLHVMRIVRRLKPRRILDVATGTGDMAITLARRIRGCQVLGVDLSEGMLEAARSKVTRQGLDERVVLDLGCAEALAVGDETIDVATVAFGVRNFEDLELGLREIVRTLKPGGHLVILEFSTPRNWLVRRVYGWYAHHVLPRVGGAISKDKAAYKYLPASVDEFPSPTAFVAILQQVGLHHCRVRSQSFGVAQIYIGEK